MCQNMPATQDKIVLFERFRQPEAFNYTLDNIENTIYAVRPLNTGIKGTEDLLQFNSPPTTVHLSFQ